MDITKFHVGQRVVETISGRLRVGTVTAIDWRGLIVRWDSIYGGDMPLEVHFSLNP